MQVELHSASDLVDAGGLIMTQAQFERLNAPWWKRIFMRRA
jgi:hypothetical protein